MILEKGEKLDNVERREGELFFRGRIRILSSFFEGIR